MTLRVLSLFSGAGGADLALEAAGYEVAALCEIEPHARAVLRYHWPDVPLHGDVAQLDATPYRGKVDVVVGGSPCQDLSVAGKRAGLTEGSGTRSSLFFEQVRIWRETEAPYLIWENVDGAFSSQKGADFAAVLSAIVGDAVAVPSDGWERGGVACGRDAVAAWRLLDLQHFGVPQRRERVVVLAARAGGVDPAQVLALGEGLRWDTAPRFAAREGVAADSAARADGAGGEAVGAGRRSVIPILEATSRQGKSVEGSVGIGKDGDPMFTLSTKQHGVLDVKAVNISDGRATLDDVMGTLDTDGASTTAIGNQTRGVVLAFTQNQRDEVRDLGAVAGALAGEPGMKQQNYVLTYDARGNGDGQIVNTLAGDHQNRVTDYTALVVNAPPPRAMAFKIRGGVEVDANGNSAGKGFLGSEEVAFTLGTSQDQHIHQPPVAHTLRGEGHDASEDGTGRGTPIVVQGVVAPTLTAANDPSRSPQSSEVTAQVAAILQAEQHVHQADAFRMVAFGEYAQDGTASAIKARDHKDATDIAVNAGVPRRLMPIECERLMGWPDDWTRWGVNEKGVRYELKDTPRYKLCGNGIGREWMEWIALRLRAAVEATP